VISCEILLAPLSICPAITGSWWGKLSPLYHAQNNCPEEGRWVRQILITKENFGREFVTKNFIVTH